MKSIAKCPKCGKPMTTNCRGCIEGKIFYCAERKCNCKIKEGTQINWKKVPENEKELLEIEEDENN